MKEQLITFETAKLAKEKGFDNVQHKEYEPYYDNYGNHVVWHALHGKRNEEEVYCEIPTQSLLQKWLREEHKINIGMAFTKAQEWNSNADFWIWRLHYNSLHGCEDSYEKALEKGLQEALKLI